MTAPRPTSTPSSRALPAPTNASSSTMTGRAPGGSSTPPIVTPAPRWTRAPIWAHDPTSTCESTIVAAPTHAPMLTYDGGMITTSSPRCAPRRTAVPPGTIRHGPPARSSRGGTPARSRKVSGPAVQSIVVRSAKQARIAVLTSGRTRQPSGADGSGSAARRRPASRSARNVAGSIAVGGSLATSAGAGRESVSVVMRPPPGFRPRVSVWIRPPAASTRPSRRSVPAMAASPSGSSGRSGARTMSEASSPISRRAAFAGTGFGPPRKLPRKSGSQRSWMRRAVSQSPASAAAHSATSSPGISLDATETTPSPPMARIGSVQASSPARTATSRGRSRQIRAICSRLPLASLTATTRGCSASRRNVSASTFVPVRDGTL